MSKISLLKFIKNKKVREQACSDQEAALEANTLATKKLLEGLKKMDDDWQKIGSR